MEIDFDPDRRELTMNTAGRSPEASVFDHLDSDILGNVIGRTRDPGSLADPGAERTKQTDPLLAT